MEEINNLNKLANIKNKLNQKYYNNALYELGIYEQNTKYFKPITEKLEKQTKAIEEFKKPIETDNALALKVPQLENFSVDTPEVLDLKVHKEYEELFNHIKLILREQKSGKSSLDTFVRRAEDSPNKLPIFKTNKTQFELDKDLSITTKDNIKYKLTKGLSELLFAGIYLEDNNVTNHDFEKYNEIVGNLNTKKFKLYSEKHGEGFTIIPSNVKELNKRLKVLIAGYKEGHKDTYNEINGILKELMNQNEINEKQYKFILSNL